MRENRRFPVYGSLPYMSVYVFLDSTEWEYCGTEQAADGTYWDIVENPYTGDYAYTNLDEVNG